MKHCFKFQALVGALLASVLACNLSPIIPAPAVSVAPYDVYVATTGRDTNTCRAAALACRTLAEAIRKSVAGGTIIIGAGTFLEASELLLTTPLTLRGAARDLTIISSRGGILRIRGHDGQVNIRDLTVTGNATAAVPALSVHEGGTLTLNRVTIRDNAGTGLIIASGTVSLNDCLISGNLVGIENRGVLQVTNSIFRRNTAFGLNNFGVAALERVDMDQNGTAARPGAGSSIVLGLPAVLNHKLPDQSPENTGIMSITASVISNSPWAAIQIDGGRVTVFSATILANQMGILGNAGFLRLGGSVIQDSRDSGLTTKGNTAGSPFVAEITQTAFLRNRIGMELLAGSIRAENITVSGSTYAGIQVDQGDLTLAFSTVAYNSGAGVSFARSTGGRATLSDSIVNLNATGRDCSDLSRILRLGTFFACDGTFNTRLHLGPLSPAAGTFVHPLQADSEARDAYTFGPCPAVDQRGYGRPAGIQCDVGAYEFGAGLHLEVETPGIIEILPSETLTPSVTPTPGAITLLLDKNANCRHGPGSVYPVLTSVLAGQTVELIGRNTQNTWWLGIIPGDFQCWVSSGSGQPEGDSSLLPVLPDPPTPIPTTKPGTDGTDFDKDGYTFDKDCNDKDAKIHPGAPETPDDKIDSNCNGNDDD